MSTFSQSNVLSPSLVAESKEEKALQARRQREAERLMRIKDPSLSGKVPKEILEAQIAEKEELKAQAKAREEAYDNERLHMDQQLTYLEQERRRLEREKLQELQDFRATHQGKDKGRDFDLSNPNSMLNDLPARTSDDDPRLSVSGLQKFHGEDLTYGYRVKAQREEIRQWSEEAAAAKAAAKAAKDAEEQAYLQNMQHINAMKADLEASARAAEAQNRRAVAEYNLAQANAKKERERAQQISEMQCNVEEIQTNLAGATLTEDYSVGRSYIAPNRVRPDHYKGMTPAEQQAIINEQALQREQRAEAEKRAKDEEARSHAEMEAMRIARCNNETLVAAKRAEMRKQMLEENKRLAEEQSTTNAFLDKVVYQNEIDDKFHSQFNTSAR